MISRPNPEIMLQPNSETSRTANAAIRSTLLIISSRFSYLPTSLYNEREHGYAGSA